MSPRLIQKLLKLMLLCCSIIATIQSSNAANDNHFPERFDTQILNRQIIQAGNEFTFESLATMGLSIAPISKTLDHYTLSLDAGMAGGNYIPPTFVGVAGRLSYSFQRDTKSEKLISLDLETNAIDKVNTYFSKSHRKSNTGKVSVGVFSTGHANAIGLDPVITYRSTKKRQKGRKLDVATYRSNKFTFQTADGSKISGRYVGYDIAANNWRVPLASGFSFDGTIRMANGGMAPLTIGKKTLTIHKISGRGIINPDRLVPRRISKKVNQRPEYSVGEYQAKKLPIWLANVNAVMMDIEALSAAIVEDRSNPLPLLAIIGTAMTVDALGTAVWNVSVDLGTAFAGNKDFKDIRPWDTEDNILKTKGIVGNITYGAGKGVEYSAIGLGLDAVSAEALGAATNSILDVGTIFIPGGQGNAANVLWGRSAHVTGLTQSFYKQMGTLAHGLAETGNQMSGANKLTAGLSKLISGIGIANNSFGLGYDVARAIDALVNSEPRGPARDSDLFITATAEIGADGVAYLKTLGYDLYAQILANNATNPIPTNTTTSQIASSTGGFSDVSLLLPLRFKIFDSGSLQDGDIVTLRVSSLAGVAIASQTVSLTFAGTVFSPIVAAGPVSVSLTAVNEGSALLIPAGCKSFPQLLQAQRTRTFY